MKWVLNTYQTAQDWGIDRIVEVCRGAGYEGVELLQDYKQAHGIEASTPDDQVIAVNGKVEDAGLFISCLTSCVVFHSPDEAERQRSINRARRVIDQAALIGCAHVRVLGDRFPEDDAPARDRILENVTQSLQALADYAQPHGVTVSIEQHSSFTDPVYVTRVVRDADRKNIGIVFNSQWRVGAASGWSLPAGAPTIAPLYDLLAPYLTSVHTHQMEQPDVWPYYRELFQLLLRDGFAGAISNECAYQGPDPEKVLRLYTALFRAFTAA